VAGDRTDSMENVALLAPSIEGVGIAIAIWKRTELLFLKVLSILKIKQRLEITKGSKSGKGG
jgi:hypothetical protein